MQIKAACSRDGASLILGKASAAERGTGHICGLLDFEDKAVLVPTLGDPLHSLSFREKLAVATYLLHLK